MDRASDGMIDARSIDLQGYYRKTGRIERVYVGNGRFVMQ